MATCMCRVQFLDDIDPFNTTNFPEPTRPPVYTFREDIPLINQIAGVHRLLKAPHKIDDCTLQLSHNGAYLDLDSTLVEQQEELEGFYEDSGRGKKHSFILRTKLSIRVHACIEKLYISDGRELRRALFSLKQIFQDDKDLVHEFVMADGLICLVKVGAESDQNYQNYILRALGQIMLYVDGMNGIINHNETVQWLYTLIGSKFRLVVKTSLKLLLVFVEYTETNSVLLTQAVTLSDIERGVKPWATIMEILKEKDNVDTELLVHGMTLINKVLERLPDDDLFYEVLDCLEELGMAAVVDRYLNKRGMDLDLIEQFSIYETTLKLVNGDDSVYNNTVNASKGRRMSVQYPQLLSRRRNRRQSVENIKNTSPDQSYSVYSLNNPLSTSGTNIESNKERQQLCVKSNDCATTSLLHQETKHERLCLGGLLTSSYRQHQESLAAERERRRQEREERLQRIEREERNKFQRNYLDIREEQRHAREERYRNVEKQAAEEYAEEVRLRIKCNKKDEFTNSFQEYSSGDKLDFTKIATEYDPCEELLLSRDNESDSFFGGICNSQPKYKESLMDYSNESESDEKGEQFGLPKEDIKNYEPGDIQQYEKERIPLSEKEKENGESNEKELCSGSSISSTSSTLESELTGEITENETGVISQNININKDSEECTTDCNSALLMVDVLNGNINEFQESDKERDENVNNNDGNTEAEMLLYNLKNRNSLNSSSDHESIENISVEILEEVFEKTFKDKINSAGFSRNTSNPDESRCEHVLDVTVQPRKDADYMWDQMMTNPKELKIKDMDFTDLADDDDLDILSIDLDVKEPTSIFPPLPPPPPFNSIGCLPPPPPAPPGCINTIPSCICPPPLPSNIGNFCGSPQLSKKEPVFSKKKKTIRLFWNEVRPFQFQSFPHSRYKEGMWSKLEPISLDTSKLEYIFESKSKDLPVTKKSATDGKRQEIIVLDSKRSNAINIGLTVLPPPRTIKMAILNFDEYALNKEGIDKILTMIPSEEEKQKIQEAQLANPDIPLGSAEQFLLTLSSISELSARLQLWAFRMDYEPLEKEIAEPLYDLKEGMDQLENNKTFACILSTLLAVGNFLNGTNAKAFDLSYLQKVPEVKDTVQKQSLLYHLCMTIVEKFPDSSDLYSEIGAITRSAKVDFNQLHDTFCNLERRCKASWDFLKMIAKHEIKSALKQKMTEFLKDCSERIIILKIVHRRIINRFHSFLLFMGHPLHAIHEVNIQRFCKIITEFALEYRTSRDRVLQQKQKWADHRERNKTRGKLITDSGHFSTHSISKQNLPQTEVYKGLQYAEDAEKHENMMAMLKASSKEGTGTFCRTRSNRGRASTDVSDRNEVTNKACSAADDIMEHIVQSATQISTTRLLSRERRRSRANRKALRTMKSGMSQEEAILLGQANAPEIQI